MNMSVTGTFGVPFRVVGTAAFNAVSIYDSHVSQLSPKRQHLRTINFVNIDRQITESLIGTFATLIRQAGQHSPAVNRVQPSITSPVNISTDASDDDSKVDVLSPRDEKCCVCAKRNRSLIARKDCSHKCCSTCRSRPLCLKCNMSAGIGMSRNVTHSKVPPDSGTQRGARDRDDLDNNKQPDVSSQPVADIPRVAARVGRSNSVDRAGLTSKLPQSQNTSTGSDKSLTDAGSDDSALAAANDSRLKRSQSLPRDNRRRYSDQRAAEQCVICMDQMTNPKKLSCGHSFCADCIDEAFKHAAKCPSCGQIFGKLQGNQPTGGTMKVRRSKDDLSGYRGAGSLIIDYEIPSGFQQDNHPHPGKLFKGTRRTAYLPATAEGQEVCKLLREAFNAGLIFTVGQSSTTGQNDVVIWNDIHHKTNKSGQYGYPDFTYLTRVKAELAAKGIGSSTTASLTAPAVTTVATTATTSSSSATAHTARERGRSSARGAIGSSVSTDSLLSGASAARVSTGASSTRVSSGYDSSSRPYTTASSATAFTTTTMASAGSRPATRSTSGTNAVDDAWAAPRQQYDVDIHTRSSGTHHDSLRGHGLVLPSKADLYSSVYGTSGSTRTGASHDIGNYLSMTSSYRSLPPDIGTSSYRTSSSDYGSSARTSRSPENMSTLDRPRSSYAAGAAGVTSASTSYPYSSHLSGSGSVSADVTGSARSRRDHFDSRPPPLSHASDLSRRGVYDTHSRVDTRRR